MVSASHSNLGSLGVVIGMSAPVDSPVSVVQTPIRLGNGHSTARLLGIVRTRTGESVELCFQCQTCASGCPVAYAMDLTPPQLLRAIRLGLDEEVLASRTIWLCASCQTCTTRCPQGIDIARVMDAVRGVSLQEGRPAALRRVRAFYLTALSNMRLFGRMYEAGLMGVLKLRTGEFKKDLGLGIAMIRKGRLRFFPSFAGLIDTQRIFWRVRAKDRKARAGH
jgi:heterodisulfide reductase subunit C2